MKKKYRVLWKYITKDFIESWGLLNLSAALENTLHFPDFPLSLLIALSICPLNICLGQSWFT